MGYSCKPCKCNAFMSSSAIEAVDFCWVKYIDVDVEGKFVYESPPGLCKKEIHYFLCHGKQLHFLKINGLLRYM